MWRTCTYKKGQKYVKKNHYIPTRMDKIKQNKTNKQTKTTDYTK